MDKWTMLSFNGWLQEIKEKEQKVLQDIKVYLTNRRFDKALDLLSSLKIDTIIGLSILSTEIADFLKSTHKQVEDFCIDHLNELGIEGIKFSMDKTSDELTPYNLLKGNFLYIKAREVRQYHSKEFTEDEISFLRKSADSFCFDAFNDLLAYNIQQLKKDTNFTFADFINPARNAATFLQTPGFILLADAFKFLAEFSKNLDYQRMGLAALTQAKLSQNEPSSIIAIYHAYHGRSLDSISQHKTWNKALKDYVTSSPFRSFRSDGTSHTILIDSRDKTETDELEEIHAYKKQKMG